MPAAKKARAGPAAEPAAEPSMSAGTAVELNGLGAAPQLNGRQGTIGSWVEDKGRFAVELAAVSAKWKNFGGPGKGRHKACTVNAKPENVRPPLRSAPKKDFWRWCLQRPRTHR